MLTAITFTNPRPLQDPINPKLVNRSINALTKPGYLRYVCLPIQNPMAAS
jgi:hypothetical protein